MQIEYTNTREEAEAYAKQWESLGYTCVIRFDGCGYKVFGK